MSWWFRVLAAAFFKFSLLVLAISLIPFAAVILIVALLRSL